MSLKSSLSQWMSKVSDDLIPGAIEEATRRKAELQKRLDHLNCSLAEKALPASRRDAVSELSLKAKALAAGQAGAKRKRAKTTRASSSKAAN